MRLTRPSRALRSTPVVPLMLALAGFAQGASAVAGSSGITLAWEAEPRSLDPRYAIDANSQYLENLLHCSLIDFDQDGRTIPDLAREWRWTNPTTLELVLTAGVKFADGTPVTSDDVKATYDFFKRADVKNPSPRKGAFAKIKTTEAKGDKVTFTLEEPDSTFVTNLVVGVLPAKLAAKEMLGEADGIVGCGAFKFKSQNPNGLELEVNEHFTLGALPKTKTISIKFVKDETTRFAKLANGEVDIVQNGISRDKVTELAKTNPRLKVFKRAGQNTTYLGFNMRDKLVSNVKVRQAIAHAVDREKIIKFVLNGLAVPATTLITPTDPFYAKDVQALTLDVAKAKKLLDEAGFKDPDGDGPKPRFQLNYKTTTDLTRVAIAKAVGADLRKIGVEVTVESLEWGRFKSDVEAGKVQMWSLAWVGFKDPDIYRFAFGTESFPPNGGNRGWYSNAELDKLMTTARTDVDATKRGDSYNKIQTIVAQELPYVFLWHEEVFAVVNKDVEDFEVYADGRYGSLTKAYKK